MRKEREINLMISLCRRATNKINLLMASIIAKGHHIRDQNQTLIKLHKAKD